MGTRVHNLEAELFKREKGPLGSKWARKLVVVDGAKRTIRYHKPNEDKRKTPRKIFRLANMSLVPSASGPKNAPAAFALTCSETGYALVLAPNRRAPATAPPHEDLSLLASRFPGLDAAAVGRAYESTHGDVDKATGVLASLEAAPKDAPPPPKTVDVEATFLEGEPLGIQLRLLPSVDGSRKIVVLTVKPTCPARDVVAPGDALTGIRGEPIETPTAESFRLVTTRLARAARPLTLTFSRLVDHDDAEAEERLESKYGAEAPTADEDDLSESSGEEDDDEDEEDEEEEEESEDDPDQCGSFGEDEETKDAASALDRTQELELLEATFRAAPLGFKLVLARYASGRLALQLNEIGGDCGCFKQLQVFDEVTHVDGAALPADAAAAFREASGRLSDAVARGAFPLTLSLARRPSVLSVDFDDEKPLGLLLRLTSASGRRAVVVHQVRGDDGAPAAALQPNDDQLVAVHGRLLPRDCTKEVFEDMMKALKKAPRPLRLTFWRASLGGADVLSGEAVEEEALLETMDGSVQDSLDAAAAAQDSLQDIAQGIAKAERLATEARAAEAVRGAADEYDDMHHQDGATPLGRPGAASDGEAEASDDDAGEPEEPEEEAPEDEAPEEPEEAPEEDSPEKAPEEAAPVEPASKLGAFLAQTPANDGSAAPSKLSAFLAAPPAPAPEPEPGSEEPAAVEAPAEPVEEPAGKSLLERARAVAAAEEAAPARAASGGARAEQAQARGL
ncbi:clathrin adaptor [Aureococcus anophagefferens]|uniref:Clathrin adaptor n=1 Tax=Aureococcus anophagefferens TaxID=44056 RepID=A0ABR1FHF4_AURAN